MIGQLRGKILRKDASEVTIDVGGVGYALSVPLSTLDALEIGRETTIYTHLHVREDVLHLYGFTTEADREAFRMLLTVNGIGPKLGQAILSGIRTHDLRNAIESSDTGLLSSITGVGKKMAERIVIELRSKVTRIDSSLPLPPESSKTMKIRSEAVVAMMSLGHSRLTAEKSVRDALISNPSSQYTVEELIRRALAEKARSADTL